eukprot:Plantae.Rhodophyta-Purpureofilum_apyrenoidigerum.ctg2760.p2 GENE.Plantae.Rhodophyta-Purpureofilum_apyrenoidigerum.ctg2760~~Plantae.Rhodophyta-Purpureofilum_apyrenoidigerum.ctg2760.p2  ORF type:complete len:187 (-),score=43.17 Plantae.Rhodophyta-Purpureofilum_apyrenoidigerum.ctg2760:1214-1774(-)
MNVEDFSAIPVRERARSELRECESLVRLLLQCFDLLATGRNSADDALQPEKITKQFVERQKVFRVIVNELVEHQKLSDAIEQVKESLRIEENKLVQLGISLREAECLLQKADDSTAARVGALRVAKALKVKDVVQYAEKVSASYAAPANWNPAEPLGNYLPPAPTEEMMRQGSLAKLSAEEEAKQK